MASSTGYGGDAKRAIDGNTDGNYQANSTTHTAEGKAELLPEWQQIHDNHFLAPAANAGRLSNDIREA